ncbi:MAG: hypothetical protein J2P45_30130 [Candidatus Dormibacteraeota bacterium]|nr:hypothetical protein [Candidatus Dormibacteraeota bacterium]
MALLMEIDGQQAELERRRLLAESDELLDRVERLRLEERRTVPPTLASAVQSLQARLGSQATSPRTVRAAQNLVFAVQQRLMASNPRNPTPHSPLGRPAGSPRVMRLPAAGTWKLLSLPAQAAGLDLEHWRELVGLTVSRALDRWSLTQGRAIRAARARHPEAPRLVARARTAWTNYWELRCEAELLLRERPPAAGRARRR